MTKAVFLFSVLLLAWTCSHQGVHTQEDDSMEKQVIDDPTGFNKTEVCVQAPETGLCRAYVERVFYNSTSMNCEMFTYGGCGGNQNNFEQVSECMEKCHTKEEEPTPTPACGEDC